MTDQWLYQVRFDLTDVASAEAARRDLSEPALTPLPEILAKHRAALKCQFDAFAEYVATAERDGVDKYPLYAWTKATIESPAKREKYLKSFTVYVEGREVYAKEIGAARASWSHHPTIAVRYQPRQQSAAAQARLALNARRVDPTSHDVRR
jgi:hypothetical protein